jgi:transcription elongation factor Elf1
MANDDPEVQAAFERNDRRRVQVEAMLENRIGRPYTCPACGSGAWFLAAITVLRHELIEPVPLASNTLAHVACHQCYAVVAFMANELPQ